MKVAITGAGGYIGSLLVRAHAWRGDTVHALARNPVGLPQAPQVIPFIADVRNSDEIPDAFFDTDVMYHCAAEISNEAAMRAVNVDATRTLLERSRGRIGHWVQLSSLSVYGAPRSGMITEESAVRARSIYAQTKAEADALVHEIAASAFTHTIVRPSGVIGPHMRHKSMYALIASVASGRFCFIGEPGAIGNFVHERNITEALVLCATQPQARQRTYNVSQNCTIEHMIDTIASALDTPLPRLRMPERLARIAAILGRAVPRFPLTKGRVDALTSRVEYSTARVERELGYRSAASIDDALRELVSLWKSRTQ